MNSPRPGPSGGSYWPAGWSTASTASAATHNSSRPAPHHRDAGPARGAAAARVRTIRVGCNTSGSHKPERLPGPRPSPCTGRWRCVALWCCWAPSSSSWRSTCAGVHPGLRPGCAGSQLRPGAPLPQRLADQAVDGAPAGGAAPPAGRHLPGGRQPAGRPPDPQQSRDTSDAHQDPQRLRRAGHEPEGGRRPAAQPSGGGAADRGHGLSADCQRGSHQCLATPRLRWTQCRVRPPTHPDKPFQESRCPRPAPPTTSRATAPS